MIRLTNTTQRLLLISTFLLILFASPFPLLSQQQETKWEWQYPKPQGGDLKDIEVFNDSSAVAVGAFGKILKTTNEGETWDVQTIDLNNYPSFEAVYFLDKKHGWVIGERGTIYLSKDSGNTWNEQYSGTNEHLRDAHFISSDTGWVVGGSFGDHSILRTTDGGNSWNEQISGTGPRLRAVHFLNRDTGWVVGGDYQGQIILYTKDGGITWNQQSTNVNKRLFDVHFKNVDTGWAIGAEGTILQTIDGGSSWNDQSIGANATLYSLHFQNELGLIGGSNGTLLKSQDGGKTWQEKANKLPETIYSIQLVNNSSGWAVGNGGSIFRTKDDGENWKMQSDSVLEKLNDIHFPTRRNGWAVGDKGLVLHTNNGGINWTQQKTGTNRDLNAVHFPEDSIGWIVGSGSTILHTKDGGKNWTPQTGASESFYAVYFTDTLNGWASGISGEIYHTNNGGKTWNSQSNNTTEWLEAIHFINPDTGWAIGGDGTILNTINGGDIWKNQTSGKSAQLSGIHFTNDSTGWIVGRDGVTLKTTDGGETWKDQGFGSSWLNDVHFPNSQNGWVVGKDDRIYHTNDGGKTWNLQYTGTRNSLLGVHFTDPLTGWIVGYGRNEGSIFHYSTCKTTNQITRAACGSYTSPSGRHIWTNSGIFTDTLSNANSAGCDSIITVDLSINKSTTSTINPSVCSSYTSPSGNQTYFKSGTYKDTLKNANQVGCDSIITINLSVENSSSAISPVACDSFAAPSGRITWKNSGTYYDTLENDFGCDSVIKIDLTIGTKTYSTITTAACQSYTVPSGDETHRKSGQYSDTITNTYGCDSIITINLTINDVDSSVNKTGDTLKAKNPGATYQWLVCDNGYAKVSGATGQSFTPSSDGNYAVAVTKNNCTDTSSCYQVETTGIASNSSKSVFEVYPNPAGDQLTIVPKDNRQPFNFELRTFTGQQLLKGKLSGTETLDISELSAGVYLLQVQSEDVVRKKKVVIE